MYKDFESFYYRATDLWKRFCEEHTELLDLTYQEYSMLLSSDVDELEKLIERKNIIIDRINHLDKARQHVISEINKNLANENRKEIENAGDLISLMNDYEKEQETKHLSKFNALLIDLIEKLKDQNKKNQLFLNKAINSLKSIQHNALGKKSFSTYNQTGRAQQNVVP